MMESVIPVMLHKYFIPSKTIKASISVCINVWNLNLSKSFFFQISTMNHICPNIEYNLEVF